MRRAFSLLLGFALLAGCGPSTDVLMLGPDSTARSPVLPKGVAIYRDTAEIP